MNDLLVNVWRHEDVSQVYVDLNSLISILNADLKSLGEASWNQRAEMDYVIPCSSHRSNGLLVIRSLLYKSASHYEVK